MRSHPPALELQPRPSACLIGWLVLLHVAAAVATWIANVDPLVKALISAALGASAVHSWRVSYRGAAGYRLVWHSAGHWSVQAKDSPAIRCDDWEATWIDPRMVVLRFRVDRWRRLTLALCADSLSPDAHRELRARLLNAACSCRESTR